MIHEHEFYWLSNSVHTKGFSLNGSARTLQIAHDGLKFKINIKRRDECLKGFKTSVTLQNIEKFSALNRRIRLSPPATMTAASSRKYVAQPKIKY